MHFDNEGRTSDITECEGPQLMCQGDAVARQEYKNCRGRGLATGVASNQSVAASAITAHESDVVSNTACRVRQAQTHNMHKVRGSYSTGCLLNVFKCPKLHATRRHTGTDSDARLLPTCDMIPEGWDIVNPKCSVIFPNVWFTIIRATSFAS